MSTIAAGTTSTTGMVQSSDTTGNLVFQTNGTTTALTINSAQVATFANTVVAPNSNIPRVFGQTGGNNSGAPTTKYDFAASGVILVDSNRTSVARGSTGTVTNDTGLSGSAANGRDQAGAFSNSSWIHFYWIWNGTTLATISSATAPPTGPTLPTGYTHWAYICTIYKNSGGSLLTTKLGGSYVIYPTYATITTSSTTSGSEVDWTSTFTTLVPTIATSFSTQLACSFVPNNGNQCTIVIYPRIVSGSNAGRVVGLLAGPAVGYVGLGGECANLVNTGNFYTYTLPSNNYAAATTEVYITNYTVPNGDA